jgi:membrane fusion protein, multidrug efflux system
LQRSSLIAVLSSGLVVALLLAGCRSPQAQSGGAPPAVPVTVGVVTEQAVPVEIHAVGTVEASSTVQVKSQVAGQLVSVRFVEGGNVSKGDLLFEIDSRPYQEALRQAEAALAKDQAQLREAEANLARDTAQSKNADAEAGRYSRLVKEGVVSTTQYDQFQTTADALREAIRADQAAIESARASIESDRSAVDRAKLDLSFCEIRSPISGRAGNLLVHAGNLVKANGDDALVVVNQVSPIFVNFGVPERHLAAIRESSGARKLPVDVSPQDNPSKSVRGNLAVIDNTVDPNTGTIRLKAVFENGDRSLWPGQFVDVALTLGTRANAVLAPAEAVQAGQQGQFVYVVKPDKTVEFRAVSVGPVVDGKVIIEKGVEAGETVVTDGQLRLFPGAQIVAVEAGTVESQVPKS